jgi:hypothetical protein
MILPLFLQNNHQQGLVVNYYVFMGRAIKKKRHGGHKAFLGKVIKKNGLMAAKHLWKKSSRKKTLIFYKCS